MIGVQVHDVKLIKETLTKSKEIQYYCDLINKYNTGPPNANADPFDLLPKSTAQTLSFTLKNTYVGFAHGIRRVLLEEIPVLALDVDEKKILTDDEFILNDMLIKNINLIPLNQEMTADAAADTYHINVFNNTNEIIDVKATDIKGRGAANIIPDPNIIIIRLRPGKKLSIKDIYIVEGICAHDAARFTLFNNVSYKPIGTPYDIYTSTGDRSITKDPTEFFIEFTTCGNISAKRVIKLAHKVIYDKVMRAKHLMEAFARGEASPDLEYKKFHTTSVEEYHFHKEYITFAAMLAQMCFVLDPNMPFCTHTIARYDSEIAIIKLRCADSKKIIIAALDKILIELDSFTDHLNRQMQSA